MRSTLNAIAPGRCVLFRKGLRDKDIGSVADKRIGTRCEGLLGCYAGLVNKLGIVEERLAVK